MNTLVIGWVLTHECGAQTHSMDVMERTLIRAGRRGKPPTEAR